MTRFSTALSLFALTAAVAAAPALADPVGELTQMQTAFSAVRSVHFDITTRDRKSISIDMIRPDRYRGSLVGGVHVIIIGSNMWMVQNGRWNKLSGTRNAGGDYLQNARTPLNGRPAREYRVFDAGPSSVNGVPAHHYRATRPGDTRVDDIWIGANHLPLQVLHVDPQGTTTILYSRFNAILPINPPM
jgi:hypothetical protein